MKIIILVIIGIFTILALNPQEFFAKRKDTEILKNIAKTQSTIPERLYSRKNNGSCQNQTFAWAAYSPEEDKTIITCK